MDDKQLLRRCSNLARAECCNFHTKDCVVDDCHCHLINPRYPTIAEGALDCDWFMEAVLPRDTELSRLVWQALTGQDGPSRNRGRLCEICRNSFIPTSHRQKYCISCGERMKHRRGLEKQRRYDEKKRAEKRA